MNNNSSNKKDSTKPKKIQDVDEKLVFNSVYELPLRNLRNHTALKTGVPPYSIFKDEELGELIKATPRTIKELQKIKGFPAGGIRVTKYGELIIAIFNQKFKANAALF